MRGARASCGSISSVSSSRSPAGSTGQRVGGASKSGSPLQQVAAIAVGPDSRGSHAVSKQSELAGLRQQQCQHAARQLFGELQVKAVASSGSYWCNLSGCDLGAEDARVGGGTQCCALPLVG